MMRLEKRAAVEDEPRSCPECGSKLKIRRWHQESLFPGERGGRPMALVFCRWPECTYSEVVVEVSS